MRGVYLVSPSGYAVRQAYPAGDLGVRLVTGMRLQALMQGLEAAASLYTMESVCAAFRGRDGQHGAYRLSAWCCR